MVFRRLHNIFKAHLNDILDRKEDEKTQAQYTYQKFEGKISDPVKTQAALLEEKYYANLEIKPGSGMEAIKKAYKIQIRKYHPDKFHNDPEKRRYAEKVTRKLNEAMTYFEKKYKQ